MSPVISASRPWALSLLALGVAACLGETTLVSVPRVPVTSFTFEFQADSDDGATAAALGWEDRIPGVALTLTPADSPPTASQQVQGSDDGTFTVDHLAAGRYVVDAVRWLTEDERARLAAGDNALGFVGRESLNTVAATTGEVPVAMAASRRGTLLFTEWAMVPAYEPALGAYSYGGYVVIANNSDSTIYVDAMLLGRATSQTFQTPNGTPCSVAIGFYADSAGLWTSQIYRFPGTGHEYPIGPGEHKLIATDAIDHRAIIPDGYDLRGADFEFLGFADVDNPSAPNLTSVGLYEDPLGHGPTGSPGSDVWYLALPTDLTALPQGVYPNTTSKFLRIPAPQVLDVVTHLNLHDFGFPFCGTYVNRRFDRKTPQLLNIYTYGLSMQRLRTGADRSGPYQWTRSSDADFVRAPKTAPR